METASMTKTTNIIDLAKEIVSKDREKMYGNKSNNHKNISKLWSAYLDKKITPKDVAILMLLLKVARTKLGKELIDNYIDMVGYAAIAGELSEVPEEEQLELFNKSYGGTV